MIEPKWKFKTNNEDDMTRKIVKNDELIIQDTDILLFNKNSDNPA